MTNGSKIGAGVRTERHDPEVVAKTIEAKAKLAEAAEEVTVVSRLEALLMAEHHALMKYYDAIDKVGEAKVERAIAKHRWREATEARRKEEDSK
jgi:hypothetical protein